MPTQYANDQLTFEPLNLCGSFGLSVGVGFQMLSHQYVGGYREDLRTGPRNGLRKYSLKYNTLSQSQQATVNVGNGAEVQNAADYLWDFYVRKMNNNREPFTVHDPRSKQLTLVVFADDDLSYEMFAAYLYSTGVNLLECRLPGFTLTDDSENPQTI